MGRSLIRNAKVLGMKFRGSLSIGPQIGESMKNSSSNKVGSRAEGAFSRSSSSVPQESYTVFKSNMSNKDSNTLDNSKIFKVKTPITESVKNELNQHTCFMCG